MNFHAVSCMRVTCARSDKDFHRSALSHAREFFHNSTASWIATNFILFPSPTASALTFRCCFGWKCLQAINICSNSGRNSDNRSWHKASTITVISCWLTVWVAKSLLIQFELLCTFRWISDKGWGQETWRQLSARITRSAFCYRAQKIRRN